MQRIHKHFLFFQLQNNLVQEIKKNEYVSTFIITPDNVIISGHRRHRACIELGIEEIEVIVRIYENKRDEIKDLILENKSNRKKTALQKANEAETLLEIEKEEAEFRRSQTLKQNRKSEDNITDTADLPYREKKGEARNLVAEQVGFKSGREVERAISVAKTIKEAERVGDNDKAEILKGQLERAPSIAEDLASNWNNIDKVELEKQKEELKSGQKSAYSLVEKAKKYEKQQNEENVIGKNIDYKSPEVTKEDISNAVNKFNARSRGEIPMEIIAYSSSVIINGIKEMVSEFGCKMTKIMSYGAFVIVDGYSDECMGWFLNAMKENELGYKLFD